MDDIENPPMFNRYGEPMKWDKVIRSVPEMISLVKTGEVTYISFDYNFDYNTASKGMTGYDVAKEILVLAKSGSISPIDYDIHSFDSAANLIDREMKDAWRVWEKEKNF